MRALTRCSSRCPSRGAGPSRSMPVACIGSPTASAKCGSLTTRTSTSRCWRACSTAAVAAMRPWAIRCSCQPARFPVGRPTSSCRPTRCGSATTRQRPPTGPRWSGCAAWRACSCTRRARFSRFDRCRPRAQRHGGVPLSATADAAGDAGHFRSTKRSQSLLMAARLEVDLLCPDARVAIELDGPTSRGSCGVPQGPTQGSSPSGERLPRAPVPGRRPRQGTRYRARRGGARAGGTQAVTHPPPARCLRPSSLRNASPGASNRRGLVSNLSTKRGGSARRGVRPDLSVGHNLLASIDLLARAAASYRTDELQPIGLRSQWRGSGPSLRNCL